MDRIRKIRKYVDGGAGITIADGEFLLSEVARLRDGLDVMMTALDKISGISEGTPRQPLLTINEISGNAIKFGNAALAEKKGD